MIYSGQLWGYYPNWSNAFEFARDKRWKLVYGQGTDDGLYGVGESPVREDFVPVSGQTPEQFAARERLQAYLDQLHGAGLTGNGADSDRDGQTDFAESIFGTDPLASASRFESHLNLTGDPSGSADVVVRFETHLDRRYQALRSISLNDGDWQPVSDPVAGNGGEITLHIPDNGSRGFYKVSVEKTR